MLKKYMRKVVSILKKYEFILKDLDCANCAREIEEALSEMEGLENVVVNFNTLKLTYMTDTVSKEDVIKAVLAVEPDVEVLEPEEAKKQEKNNSKKEKSSEILSQVFRLIVGVLIAGIGLLIEENYHMQAQNFII
jgi:Cd2+/Zn2+-exporting ATPase